MMYNNISIINIPPAPTAPKAMHCSGIGDDSFYRSFRLFLHGLSLSKTVFPRNKIFQTL